MAHGIKRLLKIFSGMMDIYRWKELKVKLSL
jgi:hypothetical protein